MNAGTMVGFDHKVCLGCAATKPLDDFYKNKGGLAGRQSRCKPCFRKQLTAPSDYRVRQGHHDDYAKPLDVRWLCKPCHDDHHRGDKNQRHDNLRFIGLTAVDRELLGLP